jgi:hypothetical protein
VLVGAIHDTLPDPSVERIYPEVPPVILTLPTFPRFATAVTLKLPENVSAETMPLPACNSILPVTSPFLTLKYLNATVPYSLYIRFSI